MMNIFLKPNDFIKKAKYDKKWGKILLFFVIDCLLFGLSFLLMSTSLFKYPLGFAFIGGIIFCLVATLILSGLVSTIMRVFVGKANFRGTMNVFVFTMFILGISSILSSLFARIPAIGIILSLLIMAFMFIYAFAFLYKGLAVMFDAELITVFIALSMIAFMGIMVIAMEWLLIFFSFISRGLIF